MRFCFIVEEQYQREPMPMVIADQLLQWGHTVDILEPHATITSLTELAEHSYDAYVLKTVTDGPGLSILQAAEAVGIPTINNARSIRLVRDRAVSTAFARAHGLPMPTTYFVAHPRLLKQVPQEDYPLIVKTSNSRSLRGALRLNSPADLKQVEFPRIVEGFLLAQRYIENTGFDIKLYVTGKEVFAVARKSPLHGEIKEGLIPLTRELNDLALTVGKLFGLDIFGLDVIDTPKGFVLLDIKDFPNFELVPRAVARISEYILHAAKRAELQRATRLKRYERRYRGISNTKAAPVTTLELVEESQ